MGDVVGAGATAGAVAGGGEGAAATATASGAGSGGPCSACAANQAKPPANAAAPHATASLGVADVAGAGAAGVVDGT